MKTSHARFVRVSCILAILVISISQAGCTSCAEPKIESSIEKAQREYGEKATYDPVTNQELTLAEGQVLLVRLRFGVALASTPDGTYSVRIDNKRNGWYDRVDYTSSVGLGGDNPTKHNDFIFNAANFNKQMTQTEYYDPKDVDGEYVLTLSNSQGWEMQKRLTWENGAFYNGGTRYYEVP